MNRRKVPLEEVIDNLENEIESMKEKRILLKKKHAMPDELLELNKRIIRAKQRLQYQKLKLPSEDKHHRARICKLIGLEIKE